MRCNINICGFIFTTLGLIFSIIGFAGISINDFKSNKLTVNAIINNNYKLENLQNYKEIKFIIKNDLHDIENKFLKISLRESNEIKLYLLGEYYDNNYIKIKNMLKSNSFEINIQTFKVNQEYIFNAIIPSNYTINDFKVEGDLGNIILTSSVNEKTNYNLFYIIIVFIIIFMIQIKTVINSNKNEKEFKKTLQEKDKELTKNLNTCSQLIKEKEIEIKNNINEYIKNKELLSDIIKDKNTEIKSLYERNRILEEDNRKYVKNLEINQYKLQEKLLKLNEGK